LRSLSKMKQGNYLLGTCLMQLLLLISKRLLANMVSSQVPELSPTVLLEDLVVLDL
jgi:hypothetical protein